MFGVRADTATGICGSTQICTINLAANGCGVGCNSTGFLTISNVHWTSSNRTLGFTADAASGTTATGNVTIPKSAVLYGKASNIKVYVQGVLLSSSQVTTTMNSTDFFTAFSVTFQSPVNAAISLGIVTGISTFPTPMILLTIGAISAGLVTLTRSRRTR